ncbi:MAG: TerC family protein, partial [Chloroflexota bacterium]|nr:TerC family protein [Chloroflexota bacterium]
MGELFTGAGLVALLTLTSLEIVLGVDNIIFISILAGKL